jgi:bifunctional DNA-binding transcriptional regulator/antitoxin component of YhaV-PrlF toxin-antitoxin module
MSRKYTKDRTSAQTSSELPLAITVLSAGGRTMVPRQVREVLKLRPAPHEERVKLLWTLEGDEEVVVSKGTLQSSYKKTILGRSGRAAVPKHVREALNLESTPQKEERMIWVRKGNEITVRKGMPESTPTD